MEEITITLTKNEWGLIEQALYEAEYNAAGNAWRYKALYELRDRIVAFVWS